MLMPTGSAKTRAVRRWVPFIILALILIFLIIVPVGMLVYASVLDSPPRPGAARGNLTLEHFRALYGSRSTLLAIRNSMLIGVGGTAIAMAIGMLLAWLGARTDVPGRWLVQLAGIMPLFMSSLVGALAWSLIGSPRAGYGNRVLDSLGIPITLNIYSVGGMVFVFGLYYAPYAYLFVASALTLMNPELEEAAEVHGGTITRVMRRITFPLVLPATMGAFILTFVLIIENFPVAQVLGSPGGVQTLPAYIFRLMAAAPSRPNQASAAGLLLMLIMVLLVTVQARLLARRSYVTVSGKGFRPRRIGLGRWRWAAFAFAATYLFVAVVVPFFALGQAALRRTQFISGVADFFDPTAFTIRSFTSLLDYGPFSLGLRNSLIVSFLTALIGGVLHLVTAYAVHRTEVPGRKMLDYVAMLPVTVPALVIGLGFLWTWINLPVPLYGTLLILVLAYTARFMPQGYRGISSTILQVHRDLEESAQVAGASRARAAATIVIPLIKTGIFSTMMLLFILSMRELSASIFLFTSDTRILSIVLYDQWTSGTYSRMAAISIVYSFILFVLTMLGRKWLGMGTSRTD
jgi:iron(III) transport system permease protein